MIFYRGTTSEPSGSYASKAWFAYYTGAVPDKLDEERVPPLLSDLYKQGKIRQILYPNDINWTVSRSYQGMSNFGYGIYFSNSLNWAKRYGNYITAVDVPEKDIFFIKWNERNIPGSPAAQLMGYVHGKSDLHSMSSQMPHFSKFCRNRKKRALFVQDGEDGQGQLVVYSKDLIWRPLCIATFFSEVTENRSFRSFLAIR